MNAWRRLLGPEEALQVSENHAWLKRSPGLKNSRALETRGPKRSPYSRLQKLVHKCTRIYAGFPSFFGLGSEDGHVPTFRLLLQEVPNATGEVPGQVQVDVKVCVQPTC